MRQKGWYGIADLPAYLGFPAMKDKAVGKGLQAGGFSRGNGTVQNRVGVLTIAGSIKAGVYGGAGEIPFQSRPCGFKLLPAV